MNSFRTEIFPEKSPFFIDYHKKVVFMGSCFTENIGNKLLENKLPALVNPFGVLYNPESVMKAIEVIIAKKTFTDEDLNFENDKWFSFDHHSSFSSHNKEEVSEKINAEIDKAHNYLKEAQSLFITFGTSWYFRLIENDEIVANCHKLPAKLFKRELLNVNEIVSSWGQLIKKIKEFNPDLKIVFTVSPIRHWKDGAIGNQLSKSVLIVAIHEILKEHKHTSYFPSYELMMDDLRDYRFYDDDFLHPNSQAINYIWDKFTATFIDDSTIQISKQAEKIVKSVNHKPFHPKTNSYKKFLEVNLEKIKQLNLKYPFIDFTKEKLHFANELEKM
ncbi:MAG: GSCFA domain-containing protein [Bacteroidota bacterium]